MADLLRSSEPSASLRSLIENAQRDRKPLVLPGCYDALGARLIEQAGFSAVYMTGFGTAASLLGRPDVGLLGLGEMADNARRITAAVDVPVLADADTGYGNAINTVHTIGSYERAGVAGVHIEDQVSPKKCGHMERKQVVETAEMVAKVQAAVASRSTDDFVVIARTDARAVNGLDDAIGRGEAFLDAGADALFIEALIDEAELERVARTFDGVPLLFNWVEGGKTPPLAYEIIAELGYAMVIMPVGALLAATAAMRGYYRDLLSTGTPASSNHDGLGFGEFTELIGLPEVEQLEQRFSTGRPLQAE